MVTARLSVGSRPDLATFFLDQLHDARFVRIARDQQLMAEPSAHQPESGEAAERQLRRGVARNRERIIEAAREVFSEQGLQAPIGDVARRAGVGIATLYRRFPTRPELITCAFTAKMQDYADATEEALGYDDPWEGFCWYVERLCEMQAGDHGFTEVLTLTFPSNAAFEEVRHRTFLRFRELTRRAKRAGRLRTDFSTEDLPLILMANAGVVAASAFAAPDAWRRIIQVILQGLEAPARAPLPKPPTRDEMLRAMQRQ
jgi:AcrR family transcriptional regulator